MPSLYCVDIYGFSGDCVYVRLVLKLTEKVTIFLKYFSCTMIVTTLFLQKKRTLLVVVSLLPLAIHLFCWQPSFFKTLLLPSLSFWECFILSSLNVSSQELYFLLWCCVPLWLQPLCYPLFSFSLSKQSAPKRSPSLCSSVYIREFYLWKFPKLWSIKELDFCGISDLLKATQVLCLEVAAQI